MKEYFWLTSTVSIFVYLTLWGLTVEPIIPWCQGLRELVHDKAHPCLSSFRLSSLPLKTLILGAMVHPAFLDLLRKLCSCKLGKQYSQRADEKSLWCCRWRSDSSGQLGWSGPLWSIQKDAATTEQSWIPGRSQEHTANGWIKRTNCQGIYVATHVMGLHSLIGGKDNTATMLEFLYCIIKWYAIHQVAPL